MKTIGHSIEFITSAPEYSKIPENNLPHIAFAGRSNVGKSSLINRLANMKSLAKVSGSPGKTRLLNTFNVDDLFFIVDLPGYGYAKVSKEMKDEWNIHMTNYLKLAAHKMLLVFLVDCRHDAQKKDLELYNFLIDNNIDFIMVATKADKLSKNNLAKNLKNLKLKYKVNEKHFFPVSSKTGYGISDLIDTIHDYIKI